ncbi:MAG: hypothetical protein LBE99_02795 [Puniceicoccales bacterium]|jgi:hypothetical protein|nr:hypothetical protein [Puniceicoccales bacterium]
MTSNIHSVSSVKPAASTTEEVVSANPSAADAADVEDFQASVSASDRKQALKEANNRFLFQRMIGSMRTSSQEQIKELQKQQAEEDSASRR